MVVGLRRLTVGDWTLYVEPPPAFDLVRFMVHNLWFMVWGLRARIDFEDTWHALPAYQTSRRMCGVVAEPASNSARPAPFRGLAPTSK